MKYLINGMKGEFLKIRHTSAIHLTYCLPAFFLFLLYFLAEASGATESIIVENNWGKSTLVQFGFFVMIFLPLIFSLFPAVVSHIEHQNNTKNLLSTMPVPTEQIFLAKIIISYLLLVASVIFVCLAIIIGFNLLCLYENIKYEMSFSSIVDLFSAALIFLFSLIPIVVLHVFIGMIFSFKLLNIFSGIIITIAANIIYFRSGGELFYIPHALPLLNYAKFIAVKDIGSIGFPALLLINITFIVLFGFSGYYLFKKKIFC